MLREHGSTTRAVFEHALQQSGIAPGPIMEIGSRERVREAVAADLGIGIVDTTELAMTAGYTRSACREAVSKSLNTPPVWRSDE